MGRPHRLCVIEDSLDGRVVTFPDPTTWQLTKKISEKPWEGSETREEEDWQPSEAHAVYDCTQICGSHPGTAAIMKVRIEVPYTLPPSDNEKERAKAASGMRLNGFTTQEIETLARLTAAGCSSTPGLLAVKVDVQDESVLNSSGRPEFQFHLGDAKWWMPGGYIVYILMVKISAQSLDINSFWNELLFTRQDRHEIRIAFQKAFVEVMRLGVHCLDSKLENLMWDKTSKKCYIIDLEDTNYDPEYANPPVWNDYHYFLWNLARDWAEPNW